MMRSLSCAVIFAAVIIGTSCLGSKSFRVAVRLPAGNSRLMVAEAEKICRDLRARGYEADVQRKFPTLSSDELKRLVLEWHPSDPSSGSGAFIVCGIDYSGELPHAKEIVDYCAQLVRNAVEARFRSSAK